MLFVVDQEMTFPEFKKRIEDWWRDTYRVNAGNVSVSQSKPDEAVIDIILTVNSYERVPPLMSAFKTEDDFELAIAAILDAVKRRLGSYYPSSLV